jgi:carbamoyltransferase
VTTLPLQIEGPIMSRVFGRYGPALPWLGRFASRLARPPVRAYFAARKLYDPGSRFGRERAASLRAKIAAGDTVYLLGIGPAGHNAGVALVEASREHGVCLICNEEEERYTGIKHCTGYPRYSVDAVRNRLADLGAAADDIHVCLAGWNFADFVSLGVQTVFEHAPASFPLSLPSSSPKFNSLHVLKAASAPRRLGEQFGLNRPLPVIGMRHHDNHAYFAWGVSPFNRAPDPVIVTVLDGYGDDGSVSLYLAQDGKLERIRSNASAQDSLGALYGIISSTQGGWTTLSSEGRYMGASAWGDNNRLTNPFYRQLRQLIYFDHEGKFHLNRAMANWHKWGELRPYNRALRKLLGDPIAPKDMWHPDHVLRVEDIQHSSFTQERLDRAAALQLLFEDVLCHVVGYLIRLTGSTKLVLTGGTALNCVANMKLLEAFDTAYYERALGKRARLHLWVPPMPSDQGVVPGAAFNFALSQGVPPGESLSHAFYCGSEPTSESIEQALSEDCEIGHIEVGSILAPEHRERMADFAAYLVSQDAVIGLFQGAAETGPRALGHRSILANPCNPKTLENINRLVKYREMIRPLAPMATLEAAQRLFELEPGGGDEDYNAYNYMVLTARVRPQSRSIIPAVIHRDGTARVQIIRDEPWSRFTYEYLKAMGRRLGVEVSVNTSLNVGSPIVQTPTQALEALKRAKGLSCLILISAEGKVFMAWHNVLVAPKDGGQRLLAWRREWCELTMQQAAV